MSTTETRTIDLAAAPALTGDRLGSVLADLKDEGFKGQVITPDDADYEDAREIWNAMVEQTPGLIVRPTDTADVAVTIRVARQHDLPPSILCGGHNVAGKGLSDGGLTIDMTAMRGVEVDPDAMVVHVQGGCQLGDVDAATAEHGVIVPAGIMSETGVGGLALGGGIGWMSRKHGLTCDNYVALELVTADGEVLEVTEESHPDLFWALRGGGGNFGVVTRFTFRAHRFGPMIRMGVAIYDSPETATEALREYAAIIPTLPNHVGYHAALKPDLPALPFVPEELVGKPGVLLFCMWLDDAESDEGAAYIDRLSKIGTPTVSAMTVMPFAAGLQKLINDDFENGHRYYTKEAHVADLHHDAIDILVDFWDDMPMDGEIEIIGLGGAIEDVSEEDSAFSNRGYDLWLNFAMRWDDPEMDSAYMGMTRKCVEDLRPWTGTGVYVNMLNPDEADRVVEAFGEEKYARLGGIKAQYDPDNFFKVNANISPLPGGKL